MLTKRRVLFIVVLLCGFLSATLHAELVKVGPIDPINGYPMWYEDSLGTRLELCLTGDGASPCIFAPVDPNFQFSTLTGFGAEAFYMLATSNIRTRQVDGDLIIGLEATYLPGDPIDGDQVTFARIRVRAGNLPVDGVYTILHPYGTVKVNVVLANTQRTSREINFTQDIGIGAPGNFTGALKGSIGPFLRWDVGYPYIDAAGNAYIGEPGLRTTLTGSPLGQNFFRIIGPDGVDITGEAEQGGVGSNEVTETRFALMGKLATRLGVTVDRAVYTRNPNGTGFIDVFASSAPNQQIEFSAPGVTVAPIPMREEPTAGRYFVRAQFTVLPAFITVANASDIPATEVTQKPVDIVTVTEAVHDTAANTLKISAVSSDLAIPPVLTAAGFSDLIGGILTVTGIVAPPATVTVTSSNGGSDAEEPVSGIGPQRPLIP